jgi:transposase
MFGKRETEEVVGRDASSKYPSPATEIILDYVLSHLKGDERPYLRLDILGISLLGLLDSGASRTVMGGTAWSQFQTLGLPLLSDTIECTVADGRVCRSIGCIQVPVKLLERVRLITIHVVPSLIEGLLLGKDFWKVMEVVPDLSKDVWYFSSDVSRTLQISTFSEKIGLFDQSSLSPAQKVILEDLISEQSRDQPQSFGKVKTVQHHIEVQPNVLPIKQRYYPVSPTKQRLIDAEVEKMLKENIIEPSQSPWSSPVCLVLKKDGDYRFCVDYRKLNSVTKPDAYPLPYISSILDQLRDCHYMSSIDIKSAFWQVEVAPDSREYTAFTVPGRGLYQFRRMPFGLINSPATWQRIMDNIIGADLEPHVFVYLDDIIIISRDFEHHMEILRLIFQRLNEAGVSINWKKCQFCRARLRYLGHIVDCKGLRPDTEKVEAILQIPEPRNVLEVRRFVGTASWYRRFIPNFASIIAPLTKLTRKNVTFAWTEECSSAFTKLKELLISAPLLSAPDFSRLFTLQCDASSFGLGAVLTQTFDDGERPICYLSRSLTRTERNLSTTEKECLCVIWAVEKLRHYLEGTRFVVITDHHSLLWLHRLKDPQGRLARWALRLQPYDFEIKHRPGKDHVVPDMLSRSVPIMCFTDATKHFSDTNDAWYKRMRESIVSDPLKYPQFRVENNVLFKYVQCQIPELAQEHDYWKKVVPKDSRLEVLSRCHDDVTSGHMGVFKTFQRIRAQYYWPKMKSDIYRYIAGCKTCAQHKVEQKPPAGLMGNRANPSAPWEIISLDFIGPFPRSSQGYTYALVVTDHFTKFVLIFPMRTATAKTLTRYLEEQVFLVYGTPRTIVCDNGAQMNGTLFRKLCAKYQVTIHFTPRYYPRANPTERVNRVIKTMIATYVKKDHSHWSDDLAAIGCAIRSACHETTGYSPYFANFGREYVALGSEH